VPEQAGELQATSNATLRYTGWPRVGAHVAARCLPLTGVGNSLSGLKT
jgi:hypothetical protein